MTIIEAIERAEDGQKIKRLARNEWLLISGGVLRYVSNRSKVHLEICDVIGLDWVCEEDEIHITKCQIESAFGKLYVNDGQIEGKNEFLMELGYKFND